MTIVAFDTLRFSRNLAEAGLAPAQADGIAAATAGALAEVVGQLATREDLAIQNQGVKAEIEALRQEMRAEFAAIRAEFRAECAAIRTEFRGECAAIRAEFQAECAAIRGEFRAEFAAHRHEVSNEIAGLRRDMAELELRMTIKLGAMMSGAVVLTAALARLL
jgi:hypothetical protein